MKLKEIRQSKHLTQQELSVQSGINLSTIQKLERGENNLSGAKSSTVIALYRVLGSDVFIAAGMTEEEINNGTDRNMPTQKSMDLGLFEIKERALNNPDGSIRVLSLFDGISCGMLALLRAGIPVECYDAFEIDKYAVTVSKNNYPDIVHHGNVFDGDFTQFRGYDLLLGGSPCTYWSIAKKGRETTSDGMGFQLFMQYVRALRESECRYFLYENNYSIHQNIKDEISKHLGVEPIMINSALLSAQNRKRCYWTNIPNVTQPDDLGIMLADVLENGMPWQDKSYCMTASYDGAVLYNTLERKQRTMVAVPLNTINGKSHTIPATYYKTGESPFSPFGSERGKQRVAIPVGAAQRGRYNGGNKTEQRIYSVRGKSVTLSANGGGQGAKTGLYKIDLPDGDYIIRKLTPIEAERLQTLPDNYTAGIPNTQRYKCIGNGWTVDVIAHILGGLHEV